MKGQRVKIIVYNDENQVEKEVESKQAVFAVKYGEGMQGAVVFQGGSMDLAQLYFELTRIMDKLEKSHPNIKRDSVFAAMINGLDEMQVEKEVHEVLPVDDTGVTE